MHVCIRGQCKHRALWYRSQEELYSLSPNAATTSPRSPRKNEFAGDNACSFAKDIGAGAPWRLVQIETPACNPCHQRACRVGNVIYSSVHLEPNSLFKFLKVIPLHHDLQHSSQRRSGSVKARKSGWPSRTGSSRNRCAVLWKWRFMFDLHKTGPVLKDRSCCLRHKY